MTLSLKLRKLALVVHVTCSVGWLGAVVAYLALALTGLTSTDADLARGAYRSLDVLAWFVIVPASVAALASGIVQSLITPWGLFKHYWVLAKLALTLVGTFILLMHAPAVSRMAALAADEVRPLLDAGMLRMQLVVHAAGGIVLLLVVTTLSVLKPWGKTPLGRRV